MHTTHGATDGTGMETIHSVEEEAILNKGAQRGMNGDNSEGRRRDEEIRCEARRGGEEEG